MKKPNLLFVIILSILFNSCGVYSFKEGKLSKDYKTFTIQNITLSAPTSYPTVSQEFTEKLKEYYQRNTSLKQVSNGADLEIEGSIIDYRTDGVAASAGGDKAAMNRLTIVVEVTFTNRLHEDESFEKEFSFYLDYPQNQTLNEAEPTLVPKILDQLVLNIFSETVAKW